MAASDPVDRNLDPEFHFHLQSSVRRHLTILVIQRRRLIVL
jgi:hypothetical protein